MVDSANASSMLISNHMDNIADQNKPAVQPDRPAPKSRAVAAFIIVVVILLIAAGVAFVIWANQGSQKGEPSKGAAPALGQATSTPAPQEQIPGTPVATGTSPTATSTPVAVPSASSTTFGVNDFHRGDTANLFLDDEVRVWDNNFPAFRVTAKNFTDSRCPKDVKCIWAGERGVEIEVVLEGTEAQPQRITLAETTRRTAQAFGLKMTLVSIDDGKGGTYAEVKFE